MQRSVFVFCFLLIQLFASGQEKFLSFKCTGNVGEPIIANKIVNEKDSAVLLTLISKGSIRRITSEPGKAPLLVLQQVNTEEEREDNPLHTSRISFSQLANY